MAGNGSCATGDCGPKPSTGSQMPGAGATFRAGSPVPLPYGSQGPLQRNVKSYAPAYPSAGIRPKSPEKAIGSRDLPAKEVPEARPQARSDYPIGHRSSPLATPEAAKTTRPLHLITDPALYWAGINPVRPSVGDWTPLQGRSRMVAFGVEGGRPLPRTWVTYPAAHKVLPFDVYSRRRLRAYNLAVREMRKQAKRSVAYSAGVSGFDVANSFRGKPGTPGGFQGSGRQERARPTRMRGRLVEQDWAPTPIVEKMAAEAERYGVPR